MDFSLLVACITDRFKEDGHEILQFHLDFNGKHDFRSPRMIESFVSRMYGIVMMRRYLSNDFEFDPGFNDTTRREKDFLSELNAIREMFILSIGEDFPKGNMDLGKLLIHNNYAPYDFSNPVLFTRWGTWLGYYVKMSAEISTFKEFFPPKELDSDAWWDPNVRATQAMYTDCFMFEVCKNQNAFKVANSLPEYRNVRYQFENEMYK